MTGYTSLQTLGGLDQPENDGAGENFMQSLVASYPHGPVAIGLYLVGALDAVNAGSLAGAIDAPGTKRAALGRPALLSAPQGYDLANGIYSADGRSFTSKTADQIRGAWFAPLHSFVAANADLIRGVSHIDADWNAQPMWSAPHDNGSFGDSRVQADPTILASWRTALADPRWANP